MTETPEQMAANLKRWRSIGLPVKKRGSSKYNSDPTESTMRGAITELKERLGPRVKREHLEREVWKHSVGARSTKDFARLQQAGREEIQVAMDPTKQKHFKAKVRKVVEEATAKARAKPAEEAKRD